MKGVVIGGGLQRRVVSVRQGKLGVVQRPRTRCIVRSVVRNTVSLYLLITPSLTPGIHLT
jgi:hypothetical protein